MEQIRVAVVLPYFGPGGAEKMVSAYVCELDQRRFHVEVFCVYGQPTKNTMEQSLNDRNVPIHYIGKEKGFSLYAILKLFVELEKYNPDVVHTHLYACVYAALWPVIKHKPFLHTFHTLPEIENERPIRRIMTKRLVKMKLMTPISISETNRDLIAVYYGIPSSTVPMVNNPVDIQRYAMCGKKNNGPFRFITVGRLSQEKNQQMMYRAFALFLSKGYDARLLVLGSGPEEAHLKSLAMELGISEQIDCTGFVENVEDYLKEADVFLLTSYYEAQPLCLLEAMAAGKPVISTDVGGVSDIVTDNGILVPVDDIGAMTAAMEILYLDEHLRGNMSERALLNVSKYDIVNTTNGYSELYCRYGNR